jgi:hypothetical protein
VINLPEFDRYRLDKKQKTALIAQAVFHILKDFFGKCFLEIF